MRPVFIHRSSAVTGLAKSVLEAAGIPCFVANEAPHAQMDGSMIGPVRFHDPAVCIANDDDWEAASALVNEALGNEGTHDKRTEWTCTCGEAVPGNFDQCWSCESLRADG